MQRSKAKAQQTRKSCEVPIPTSATGPRRRIGVDFSKGNRIIWNRVLASGNWVLGQEVKSSRNGAFGGNATSRLVRAGRARLRATCCHILCKTRIGAGASHFSTAYSSLSRLHPLLDTSMFRKKFYESGIELRESRLGHGLDLGEQNSLVSERAATWG